MPASLEIIAMMNVIGEGREEVGNQAQVSSEKS
jgi:hypothetical protein